MAVKRNTIVLILFFLSLYSFPNYREFSIEHISTDAGISNKTITAIIQDRDGYMWFGTESGLNRYDGYNFKIFKNDPDDPTSLPCNRISSLLIDKNGTLWVGMKGGGVGRYRKGREDFERLFLSTENTDSKANVVLSSLEDSKGDLWFGTWGEGLFRLEKETGKFVCFKPFPESQNNSIGNRVGRIFEDSLGNLWIGTKTGLFIFDRLTEEFFGFSTEEDGAGNKNRRTVLSIFEDSYGKIWIGTHQGLLIADPDNKKLEKPEYTWADQLNSTRVYKILEDKYRRLWIGSWSGLFEVSMNRELIREYSDRGDAGIRLSSGLLLDLYINREGVFWIGTMTGLNFFNGNRTGFRNYDMRGILPKEYNSYYFTTILEDTDNTLWMGTMKNGVFRYNRSTGEIRNLRKENGSNDSLKSNAVIVIKGGIGKYIYIGTDGGFNIFDRKEGKLIRHESNKEGEPGLSNNEVYSIVEFAPDKLLIGTLKGLNLLDIRTGKYKNYFHDPEDPGSISDELITFILKDRAKRVWVGTYGGGLNRYIPESDSFERISEPAEGGLKRNYLYSAIESRDGMLWMGSNEAGLKMFDPEKKSFRNYYQKDGLPSKTVWDVLEDGSGNIWFNTTAGISMLSVSDGSVTNFSRPDGILIDFFKSNSGTTGISGEMFFSGQNGFVSFYPDTIIKTSTKPLISITSIKSMENNGNIRFCDPFKKGLEFSHGNRMLTFDFSALSFVNPKKNQYKYQMTGLSDEWLDIGNDNSVTFGRLNPGRYEFRVKGANCFGVWGDEGTSMEFTITPPFWQTWWFRMILLSFLLAAIFLFHRSRLIRLEKKLRDETDMDKLFHRKGISKREREIILLIIQGKTSREIEDLLFISYGTVKNHIYSIYKKLNVKNRAEIVNLFKDIKSF